jgi:NADH-quinone oxidoreductase subunit G
LGFYKTIDGSNQVLEDLNKHKYKLIYLLGQDSLEFNKQNEFIIYQGSHGDKGAQIADLILPGAAYTEQNGYFTNLEGKLQKAYKASYPPGESKEDWLIINELSKILNKKKLFNNKDELESSMLNYLNLYKEKNSTESYSDKTNLNFFSEQILIKDNDYYYSNPIARSSKTMFYCRNEKIKFEGTGTEG